MRAVSTILLFLSLISLGWSQTISFSLGLIEPMDVLVVDPDDIPKLHPSHDEGEYVPEHPAYYPGGWKALNIYFREEGKVDDPQLSSGGEIYISFIINEDGLAQDIKVLKAFNHQKSKEEAIRLVRNMPQWVAAEEDGRRIKSKIVLPILVRVE